MIYRLRYYNKDGVEARVDIQKGLATPVIEVEGTERPFILSYNNDKGNKSGMFLSSSADIEIYETTDFNINNLKTSNETELSVTHYINNVVSWRGFIIPDFFSIEVRNNPVITMTASDRLGTLKNVTLSDLPTMVNIRELILTCLSKTGLSLPLKTIADFSNDGTVNAFFSYYIDSQRIKDIKGRSISCYDILSSILIASNSKLVQRAGEWVIINKLQHEIGSGKIYSSLSSFTNYLENIYNFEEVSIGARRTIMPVAGSVGIYHEHGGRKSHPANYDFSLDLSGWNRVNDFTATIENRHIIGFLGGTPLFDDERTVKQYLLNYNNWIDNTTNLNTAPYIATDAIPVNSPRADRVEVAVDISSTMAEKLSSNTAISFLRYAVILTNGVKTYTLTKAGIFEELDPENISGHSLLLRGGQQPPLLLASPAFSNSDSFKGLFEVGEDDDVNNYSATIRIYGSGDQYVTVNYAIIKFSDVSELPKGTMYKTEQGEVFTKAYDIETSIFGDYLLSGLDGYFYRYPNDDTSSIYKDVNTLSTPVWTTPSIPNETSELPLLHHSMRQMRRMFSVAHDLLSAEIEVNNFDPLAIFVACEKRYTVVSAQFDFFKSNLSVELEEVAFQSASVRDYIYSYFGDGETGIKSIGGISGGTGGGGGGGLTGDQIAILNDVAELAHSHENKEVLDQITHDMVDNASREMIISTDAEAELTDENYLSSLRVLAEILKNNETLKDLFISKINPDTAQEIIKFVKGVEIGDFTTGPLGAGASLKMENGVSRLEIDQLDVRMRATFRELIIESLKHIGGQLILSPARMKCTRVVDGGTYYRCYFDMGDGKVSNEFVAGDQARCQVFTGSGVKMYWRLVTSVGTDWINLSKTDAISGSSIPEAGDDIVQLGNRTDTTRQNAQILSTVGSDAPSWKQYKGINAFSLEGKDTTVFSGTGNKIDGKTVFMSSGANVEDGINSKNSNYSSQPTSYKANDTWTLAADTTVNGTAYKAGEILTATQDSETFVQAHWVKRVRYTDDTAVDNLEIGGVNLINGNTENITLANIGWVQIPLSSKLVQGNTYILGGAFQIDNGTSGAVGLNNNDWGISFQSLPLNIPFVANANMANKTHFCVAKQAGTSELIVSAIKVKLEEGNKKTAWSQSPEYIQAKIDSAKLTAEQAQLQADGYMRARYVRDWVKGSSVNSYNHWSEIKIANKTGDNLAIGKTPTSNGAWNQSFPASNATDNNISTFAAISNATSVANYVQIDLGQVYYDIDFIQVWHYYADGRTYFGTKTEISEDGVNWTTIFDSAIEGTYTETEEGKIHSQRWAKVMAKLNRSKAVTDKFHTTIDGGLINTVTVELREADTQDVTAGISGIQGSGKKDPAFWAGGTYDQAFDGTAKAIIRHDGSSKFTDTEITGTINAKNGTIEKLTMAPNGVIELPPTFTSHKGRIDNSGIKLVYDGDNSQKIEWHTGLGTFSGLIAPNSQGHLTLSSSFGVGVQSQLINIGTEAFAGNINIGNGLSKIDFNNSSINNIKEMTNIGYTSMASLTFIVPDNTSLILRHDTPLSILTSVGSNSFIKSIYMNNNNLLRDGAVKWILNRSASDISIARDGNIRIASKNDIDWVIKGYSIAPFIYSAGYWYKHSDHR